MIRTDIGSASIGRLLLAVLLLGMLMVTTAPPAKCMVTDQSHLAPKYIMIPLLYVTDRAIQGDTYGADRRYPTRCQHHMYYGTMYVGVLNEKNKNSDELFAKLGWQGTDKAPPKIAPKDKIDSDDNAAAKKQFFTRITDSLDKCGQSELCIFAHGAADGFEDCAWDAAQLAYRLERPMVLYSWPANQKWRGYFADNSNCEWSQGHFNMFCQDLINLQVTHPFKVIAISHSLGNRLWIRALPVVYGKNLVSDWELVSPDIDADTCRHYTMGYTQQNAKLRLYVSNKDKMLALSQLLAGGYYRLGEAAAPTFSGRHHRSADSESPSAAQESVERIDFTTVDSGFHGHSIPFDLIANMINNDKPGDGLDLEPETEVKANRLVRMVGHKQKLSDVQHESSSICRKVVKTK